MPRLKMHNEDWKHEGTSPTIEDCKKYKYCGTKFLARLDMYAGALESTIVDVSESGMVRLSYGFGGTPWLDPSEIKIVELLPPPTQRQFSMMDAGTLMHSIVFAAPEPEPAPKKKRKWYQIFWYGA